MKKINICIIGAGNISNTRHIPAIKKSGKFNIVGVISDEHKKIERTLNNHKELKSVNTLLIDHNIDYLPQLQKCEWFVKSVDAVIIGTPPKQHFPMVKVCLMLDKHVLVEKPMMMNVEQCDEVLELSKQHEKVLNVMHSFQFSNGMEKLYKVYSNGELGELKSILELQLSNRKRRLPVWYNELPLGLYYDEAAHFFYGARRFGGKLKVLNAHAAFNGDNDNTPRFLQAQLMSGDIPVQMYMNFNSPICEWGLILIGTEKIAIYDYFKDILIILNNDGEHYAKEVLKTSIGFSWQFWKGFVKNGFKMVSGQLLYGHEKCVQKYAEQILENKNCFELSAELGKEVVSAMNEVVKYAKEK